MFSGVNFLRDGVVPGWRKRMRNETKKFSTRKLTTVGMLCAVAYAAVVLGRVPVVLFLKYDPKDVIIVIGGLLFGPLEAFLIAGIVSVTEMLTISGTGIFGCVMNIISSVSFACTTAWIYQKKRQFSGVASGLVCGVLCQVTVMMLWNYLIAPLYMGYPREEVVKLLWSAFLPFNLLKGTMNALLSLLLWRMMIKSPIKKMISR